MIVAFLFVGSIFGLATGATTLMLGYSVWYALLYYSVAGAVSTLAVSLLYAFLHEASDRKSSRSETDARLIQS